MTSEELIERYNQGKCDFPWVNLEGQSFDGLHAPGLRLMRAKLARTRWKSAQLDRLQGRRIDAPDSCFVGASLMGSVLSKANLAGADLRDADLTGADLSGANLTGARLDRAILRGTTLDRADLSGATIADTAWEHLRAVDVRFDDATIAPDGTDWDTWRAQHLAPADPEDADNPAAEDETDDRAPDDILAERTDPRRTFMPRILSLANYRPDVVKFSPRGIRRRSLLENVSIHLLGFQLFGYGSAGAIVGALGLPFFAIAAPALAVIGWRWDRQLTLVAPFLTIVIVFAALMPLPSLLAMLLFVGIAMSVLTLSFMLQYGLLPGLRNALWIGCWAMLFLLVTNGVFGIIGGAIDLWLGSLAIASAALCLASSTLWIDLALRGYSERQALEMCALFGSGGIVAGWLLAVIFG